MEVLVKCGHKTFEDFKGIKMSWLVMLFSLLKLILIKINGMKSSKFHTFVPFFSSFMT